MKYFDILRLLNKIKDELETKTFKYEIIKPSKFCNTNSVFAGIEPDPRGIPIYSITLVYHIYKLSKFGFEPKILFADKHAQIVSRPFFSSEKIESIKLKWKRLFEIFDIEPEFFESQIIYKDEKYKEIYNKIKQTKNKFKYLPKEIREFYKHFQYVNNSEWTYVNLEVTDVLFFKPSIFFSDLPERPLHIALHEKAKSINFNHLPFSFLSPTIPPLVEDEPAPTFYWLSDFRNFYRNVISIFDTYINIKNRILSARSIKALIFIWLFVINPVIKLLNLSLDRYEIYDINQVENLKIKTANILVDIIEHLRREL